MATFDVWLPLKSGRRRAGNNVRSTPRKRAKNQLSSKSPYDSRETFRRSIWQQVVAQMTLSEMERLVLANQLTILELRTRRTQY